jgi:two-component system, NtrC family, response regulator HydG
MTEDLLPMQSVLVVDDEAGVRVTLGANLELEGFEVVEAESGEHALEIAAERPFDLVISDIKMTGINGVELFHRLRERNFQVPVVLMTAFALETLVREALEDGAFAVLSKPFEVDHVLRVARRAASDPVVLVIDGAPALAQTLCVALEAAGLRARAVVDGASAEAAIAEANIDVCVVDLVLMADSGARVIERLRAASPRVSVIAMSGDEAPELLRQMGLKGMRTLLSKPIRPAELIRVIAQARGDAR